MKTWLAVLLLAAGACQAAAPRTPAFSFAVLAHVARGYEDGALREAVTAADAADPAFLVVHGLKREDEACSDTTYDERLEWIAAAHHPVIVSLAASDWTACVSAAQLRAAPERLARLRELLYADNTSLGGERLAVTRQSAAPKFAAYAENMRWESGGILFATLNLPANNNNYRAQAGRNSEFEDRAVATREWLQRLFALAVREQRAGLVLFTDADPFAAADKPDGYADVRRLLPVLAANFKGKVLLVHGGQDAAGAAIRWQKNLGVLAAGRTDESNWLEVKVRPAAAEPFKLGRGAAQKKK